MDQYVNSSNVFVKPVLTPDQQKILLKYFTNIDKPVYAFTKNMPTEVAGALISRFSRTNVSPRLLFLDEFLKNPDLDLDSTPLDLRNSSSTLLTQNNDIEGEASAKERAMKFFRQVLAKYGDESVAEITGVYIVVEKASTIAIKVIESMRRMAFIEQSTRYIDLTEKVEGQYLYFRDKVALETFSEYEKMADNLFDTYREWFEDVKNYVTTQNPMLGDDTEIGYKQAVHSRTCDVLRELLPIGMRATVGVYGNGRDWSELINIMLSHELEEVNDVGKMILEEVTKIIPSIMERTSGTHGQANQNYLRDKNKLINKAKNISTFSHYPSGKIHEENIISTKILSISDHVLERICAGTVYGKLDKSFDEIFEYYKINPSKTTELIAQISDIRKNRFDKVPEGFEQARIEVEFTAPWSCWKDIQRHRRLTELHNTYFADEGFYIAPEISNMGLEKEYTKLVSTVLEFIRKGKENHPELAANLEYLVPHGANIKWIMNMDFAEAIYMLELRSISSGHVSYRSLMHSFYYELEKIDLNIANLAKFIDLENYYLGRRQSYNKVVEKGASLE